MFHWHMFPDLISVLLLLVHEPEKPMPQDICSLYRLRLTPLQCDQIGRNFAIGHFLHFYPNEQFLSMICCTYFNIQ